MAYNPKKKYYKIGEVAAQFGIETHTLRFWETQFPQLRPKRYRSGHRFYTQKEIEITSVIYDLLYNQNFTIRGAQQKIEEFFSKNYKENDKTEHPVILRKDDILDIKNELENIKNLIEEL